MSYIGAQPTTAAFPFDQFSGNGTTTAFTMSYAPASTTSIVVSISGVVQNPTTYAITGLTLTFSQAPPTGTNNIGVLFLGLPASGVSTPGNTAYLSTTQFTATAGQTTFTPSGTYQTGFINVIRNGSQLAPTDYTATNGTTVVLSTAASLGDVVVIEVYNLTSVTNALPLTGGTVTGATTFNSTVAVSGASTFNAGVNLAVSSGNVGIGTTSPNFNSVTGTVCHINNSTAGAWAVNHYTNGTTGSAAADGLIVGNIAGDAYIFNYENSPIYFGVNGATQAALTAAGLFQFNSGYGSVATAYGCRAWVNFNGTGTVAIRSSGNVTSITDNAVGDYTVNFTTAMPDANYGVNGIVQFNQSGNTSDHYLMALEIQNISTAMQTGSVRVVGKYAQSVSPYDMTTICVSIFR
jgi:hypothetical protein